MFPKIIVLKICLNNSPNQITRIYTNCFLLPFSQIWASLLNLESIGAKCLYSFVKKRKTQPWFRM